MDTETKKLVSCYQNLPEAEQKILQVLSVMSEPRKQGTFQDILKTLAWRSEQGKSLATLMSKPLREKLLELALITYDKYQLQCHLGIIEFLTAKTLENGTFTEILAAVRKVLPLPPNPIPYNFINSRPKYKEFQPRIALHQNNEQALLKQFQIKNINRASILSAEEIEVLFSAYQRFLASDENLLNAISGRLKYFTLLTVSLERLSLLHPNKAVEEWLDKPLPASIKKDAEITGLLAELRLMQGRLPEVEALLKNNHSAQGLSVKAWAELLKGYKKTSLLYYQTALAATKKTTRKRHTYIPGLAGIFHIMALLSTGEKQDRQLARQQIRHMQASNEITAFTQTLSQLEELIDIQQGVNRSDQEFFLSRPVFSYSPLAFLFQAIQILWTGKKLGSQFIPPFMKDHHAALRAKAGWFAWQVEQLLLQCKLSGLSEATVNTIKNIKPLPLGFNDLSQLITPRKPWEIALDALQEITLPQDDLSGTDTIESDMRMTWRVNIGHYGAEVEPREQKLSKNGQWTKGRMVALKKLYSERQDYPYLTNQDQQICNQIQKDNYMDHGYMRTDFSLLHREALFAAIGHPLVFMTDNLNLPINVVEDEPRLIVEEVNGGKSLRLQITPYSEHSGITVNKESDQKISVARYSTQHEKIATILGKKGITVPKRAEKQVMDRVTSLAPLLTVHSDIAISHSDIETVDAQQILHFHLYPMDEGLKFSAYIQPFDTPQPLFRPAEGGATVFAEINHQQVQTHRDLKAEKNQLNRVLQQCPALYQNSQYEWHLDDPEAALETLFQLQELGDDAQLEWPQGKKITLNHAAKLSSMSVNIRKSQDWFSVTGALQIDDEQVLEMRQLMNLLAQSSGRFIHLGKKQFLVLTQELRNRLDAIQAYTSDKGQFHALALPAMDELVDGMKVKASKPWKDQLKRLQASQKIETTLPSTLQAELRDYQLEGFQWASRLAYWGAGACLADDMGLGKTLQALALILTRCKQGATLVLAPTSVCNNWETEVYRFAPTLKVKRFGVGDRQKMLDNADAFDLVICSYGLLQSEAKRLTAVKWHTIIADEAQAIKNHQAKRTKAAMQLQADFRMITTGTPIENHLGELWSLFRFINPGLLGSLEQFNTRYATPIERDNDHQTRQQLKNLIAPFILRRLKSDVLTELPPRTEITLKVELSSEEKTLYEAMRQQAMENVAEAEHPGQQRMQILAEIMKLRRACCNPRLVMPDSNIASAKLEAFTGIVEDLQANHHKALVFSQFVGHLALIREYLDQKHIDYQYLDGATPAKKRQQAVNSFQAGEGELFLISLKAGGSGLNLTAADYVIHLDPWWNPAVEDQASDRAHRIGQQRPVTVYRLVAKDTIEEKIVNMHQQKRDLADSLLEGTEMSGKLSVNDILALLKEQ